MVLRRLRTKTNCGGADLNLDIRTQANKDKIRDLRLRRGITGTVRKPLPPTAPEKTRGRASEVISDEAALAGFLQELPKLTRLRKKSKPPEGYVMYGPLDVHEAVAEYMQAEPRVLPAPRGQTPSLPKAMHNQAELDEAVYLYSQDPKERRLLKGLGQNDIPNSGETTRLTPHIPVEEHSWHASARRALPSAEEAGKRRSKPLGTLSSTSRGSGMQYKPREEHPPGLGPVRAQEPLVGSTTEAGQKRQGPGHSGKSGRK